MLGFKDYLKEAKDLNKWEPSLVYLEDTFQFHYWDTPEAGRAEILAFMQRQNRRLHKCFPNPQAILAHIHFEAFRDTDGKYYRIHVHKDTRDMGSGLNTRYYLPRGKMNNE